MIRNARNAVEHERPEMMLVAADFALNSQNQLVRPIVQLVHPKTPFDGTPIREFMSSACANISDIVELMMVFLCARHVDASGNLSIIVIEIPTDRRFNPNVRYGFGVMIGGADGSSVMNTTHNYVFKWTPGTGCVQINHYRPGAA